MSFETQTSPITLEPEGTAFSRFMASCGGRMLRFGLGTAVVTAGLGAIGGPVGLAVAGAGLVPLAAGLFNLCPVAPLWGGHFFGSQYCAGK